MATFPFAPLRAPITDDAPCGVDLELLGDDDYYQFDAQIGLVLPESYATFDRREANIGKNLTSAGALLARSHDLRILVSVAKLMMLDRELGGFVEALESIVFLLNERWDSVFPALLDGDPTLRLIALQSLDDTPHTVQPLMAAPLLVSRRLGSISLRSSLLADGGLQPRAIGGDPDNPEMEKVPTTADFQSALKENTIEAMVATLELLQRLVTALDAIEASYLDKSGQAGVLSFKRLKPVARDALQFLSRLAAEKDPTRAAIAAEPDADPVSAGEGAPQAIGRVTTRDAAVAALAAASGYFSVHEPSSPVRMVLVQVNELIGKSFYDALLALVPDLAGRATLRPARNLALSLPVEKLAGLLTDPAPGEEVSGWSGGDGWGESADSGATDSSEGEESSEMGEAESSGVAGSVSEAYAGSAPEGFQARTRAEAMALIGAVASYLRQTEPSSPIPLILDHAAVLAGRDFITLLKEMLPADALLVQDE